MLHWCIYIYVVTLHFLVYVELSLKHATLQMYKLLTLCIMCLIDIINADKHWSNAGLAGTAPSVGK